MSIRQYLAEYQIDGGDINIIFKYMKCFYMSNFI